MMGSDGRAGVWYHSLLHPPTALGSAQQVRKLSTAETRAKAKPKGPAAGGGLQTALLRICMVIPLTAVGVVQLKQGTLWLA